MDKVSNNKKMMIIIGVIVLIVIWFIAGMNSINTKEIAVDKQYANIDTQLQRRMDLIPNLVNSVKGEMNNEKEIFSNIADARKVVDQTDADKNATTDEKVAAQNNYAEKAQILVNAIRENYPTLASSNSVRQLMDELAGTENRIAVERQKYNDDVRDYNAAIRMFPNNIIAKILGKHSKDYFKAVDAANTAPTVNL